MPRRRGSWVRSRPLFLILARLGRRPAVHQGLLATFAVFMGSLFVVYATRWGF
jgi:hypothetical protein